MHKAMRFLGNASIHEWICKVNFFDHYIMNKFNFK